ncbi:MAG: glycoside hydrolase family 3 C-terminal domain-containing protein [Candidatus Symbiothrix sp.]|nr:glycoside hydrolase family 3 C-terminal domain-containing protein [Candidatus Symbiothrix sp.]
MLLLASSLVAQTKTPVYQNLNAPIEDRIEDALLRMTLEEKVAMIHAQSKFCSPGVARLGIPENWTSDGPHGIRAEVFWDEWDQAGWTNDSCMAFPALTCLAATWNPEMASLYGKSIGEEARYRNKNILLGPGVNIYRLPLNGRNFEYMGEDPYLASKMVVPYIQGVQKNHVAACVKHYALNNQELDRDHINVNVSDRALYEIYLPAFKAAVQEGGAWAIMGAYNQYKNQHSCHNQYLLNDILKRDWKFDGVVISDWGGVHNTNESIHNGLDMEFGSWTNGLTWSASNAYDNYYLAVPYLNLLRSGKEDVKILDEKVRRVLRLIFRTNMAPTRSFGSFVSDEHRLAGRTIAEEGIVLLQNKNNVLPVDVNKTRKIAVIGENAIKMMTIGGGSSSLKAKYETSPLKGIQDRAAKNNVEVVYERGYVGETSAQQDGMSVADIKDDRSAEQLLNDAINAAKTADWVIFVGGLNKHEFQDSEGNDRKTMDLPYGQDKLISELVKANPKTAVVILSGNAVSMPWVNQVPAIVETWYNGSEAGSALASILFGDVNPSGKLPFSFPVNLKDNGAIALGAYPGDNKNVTYSEDILVGYRWHDTKKIKPLFAFGHGLSYTQFAYGKLSINKKAIAQGEKLTVAIPVKNIGQRAGAEIVQLYIRDEKSSLPRPEKELKGFSKINLQAGEEKTVTFTIEPEMLQFYDDRQGAWVAEPGKFEVLIGASAVDIRQKVDFNLQ